MRKKTILVVAAILLLAGNLKAQIFDFSQNLTDVTIGFNLGSVGYDFNGHIDKTYAGFGGGVNVSILGVYIDFIYQNPKHRYDRKVTFTEYHDHTALTINVGYKIPVTSWMNLTPLIGYSNETSGVTLGNSIGVESENHRICAMPFITISTMESAFRSSLSDCWRLVALSPLMPSMAISRSMSLKNNNYTSPINIITNN